jgi:ElaB/YqjD/DUF883 family membrane-anchored ribosome-binding protein
MGERAGDVSSNDPHEIHEDIARTREEMSETIDEIQERLSPRNIQAQATQRVRSATIGRAEQAGANMKETGMSMLETIKQNPLPTALVGIGLGWLYMSRSSGSTDQEEQPRYTTARGYPRYSGGEVYRRTDQDDESSMERAQEIGGQMRERTAQTGEMAQEQVQRARSQSERMFEDNPLAIGVLAFGAGALVGLWIPETAQEHRMMGEQRDQLLQQAKSTAEDKVERAERVAERAIDEAQTAAEDEARQQDLTE